MDVKGFLWVLFHIAMKDVPLGAKTTECLSNANATLREKAVLHQLFSVTSLPPNGTSS